MVLRRSASERFSGRKHFRRNSGEKIRLISSTHCRFQEKKSHIDLVVPAAAKFLVKRSNSLPIPSHPIPKTRSLMLLCTQTSIKIEKEQFKHLNTNNILRAIPNLTKDVLIPRNALQRDSASTLAFQ
jgi:hypothetical protein